MAYTLRNVLDDIASFINQDPALVSGTDLTSQVNIINQVQNEWGDTYQWKQLRVPYVPTFAYSGTALALPANFKKAMSKIYDVSKTDTNDYDEIEPADRFTKPSTERYFYTGGNDAAGKYFVINPPLMSGASLTLDIQVTPSSVATLQDVMTCPSRAFITARSIAKILAARSDTRFPTFKAESDDLLANMIEEEATPSGAMNNQIDTYFRRINYRIGND